jgi:amino acid transporter
VRDPTRVIPKAILFGVLGVGVVYLLLKTQPTVRVLGLDGVAHTPQFAAVVAERTFGGAGARALRAPWAVSAIGLCAVNVIVSAVDLRRNGAAACSSRASAALHARTGAPVAALCAQLVLALPICAGCTRRRSFGASSRAWTSTR